jgi:hypothetical protein
LAIVLQLLRQYKLSAKLSKCSFATETVEYLGHVLSGHRVATDPSKIVDILSWATPTTVTQLRAFLGLTRYYRCFVQNYATICRPLHEALKKNNFTWERDKMRLSPN